MRLKAILENAVSNLENADTRFAQIAGFRFTYNPTATAQITDADGNIVAAGARVVDMEIENGTVLVRGVVVNVGAPDISVVTVDFLAGGGDQYQFGDARFKVLGVSYQQALFRFITDILGGVISTDDYQEGGEGRITTVR